ncbi:MAG: 5'-methylthioadenosine/adenosylhomocysteine nucleosidase [Undibacterium sp.]|nr:5'-methylthioadenosine/adenosylhomocysteine nucleosidase [Undibacterium sp.]
MKKKLNTTGLIFAMPEEQQGLEPLIQNLIVHTIANRRFLQGDLWGNSIVCVLSGIGKVAAASTTAILIQQFKVNQVILSGVAGAGSPDLHLGDIVIANALLQHDMNALPLCPRFEIPFTGQSRFFSNHDINSCLIRAAQHFLSQKMIYTIKENERQQFNLLPNRVQIKQGLIASGDQFIQDAQILNQLRVLLPDLLAVEMEGAAIAQVCQDFDVPYAVLRIISDNANENAHMDFQGFIQKVAALMSLGVLEIYFLAQMSNN